MKQLSLWRHAKSSWDDPGLPDHDRVLSARGRRAAARMARFQAETGEPPDLVLCSTSARTRETLAALGPLLPDGTRIEFDPELYLAPLEVLIEKARRLPESCSHALLIGHNPGTELLAAWLLGSDGGAEGERLRAKYPTAALARFALPVAEWKQLREGEAQLLDFTRPKDLD